MSAFSWVAVITLLAGTLWTLPALVRRRFRDPMRLHLCLSLFLMGLGNVVSHPPVGRFIDAHTVAGFAKTGYNTMILVGLCLMVGFLRERPLGRWSALPSWEVALCLVCLAGMLAMSALLPCRLRNHALTSAYLADWRVRVFYDFGNFYLLFGYAVCAVLAWRHAREGGRLRRVSLTAICVGLVGLALSCVFRFAWVNVPALRAPGRPVTYEDDFAFGIAATIVVCAGLSLPFFVGLAQITREWLDHRAQFRGLEELWRRLVAFYPELVLDYHPDRGRRRLTVAGHASAVYRRYVECRDGLTRLGPYLRLAAEELPDGAAAGEPRASALLIDRALHLLGEQGADGAAPKEASLFLPGGDHYEGDIVALIRVSGELQALRGGSTTKRADERMASDN